MHDSATKVYIYEDEIDNIVESLKGNAIRMAKNLAEPWNPLRPDKEIIYDSTGQWVMPSNEVGISLACSVKQLGKIFYPGRYNYFLAVDRSIPLPDGLAMVKESIDHWMIVVVKKMSFSDYMAKVQSLSREWKTMGRYYRNG